MDEVERFVAEQTADFITGNVTANTATTVPQHEYWTPVAANTLGVRNETIDDGPLWVFDSQPTYYIHDRLHAYENWATYFNVPPEDLTTQWARYANYAPIVDSAVVQPGSATNDGGKQTVVFDNLKEFLES